VSVVVVVEPRATQALKATREPIRAIPGFRVIPVWGFRVIPE
jgi:hypothetical protein